MWRFGFCAAAVLATRAATLGLAARALAIAALDILGLATRTLASPALGLATSTLATVALDSPAVAQTFPTHADHAHRPHGAGVEHLGRDAFGRHPRGITLPVVEPSRVGPAPSGYWYRCDAPPGYYPFIRVCGTPWRIVPSAPHR